MNRSMITATNTMSQIQKQIDLIGNNLANVDTNGYKRRETTFNDLLVQQLDNEPADAIGRLTPNGIRLGSGARLGHTNVIMAQGAIKLTDRQLDVAFTKEGQMLQVMANEDGRETIRYTRDGSLHLTPAENNQVALVTSEGYPVLDQYGDPITFDQNFKEIQISKNGTLTAIPNGAGQARSFELGIVQVQRPQMLESAGGSLYALPDLAALNLNQNEILTNLIGNARQEIGIQQRALESSNVDMSLEMTELINSQRSYQFNAKSISIADQMMGLVNGIR